MTSPHLITDEVTNEMIALVGQITPVHSERALDELASRLLGLSGGEPATARAATCEILNRARYCTDTEVRGTIMSVEVLLGHLLFQQAAESRFCAFDDHQFDYDETLLMAKAMTHEKAQVVLEAIPAGMHNSNRIHNLSDLLIEGNASQSVLTHLPSTDLLALGRDAQVRLIRSHPLHQLMAFEALSNLALANGVVDLYQEYLRRVRECWGTASPRAVAHGTWWGSRYFGTRKRMIESHSDLLTKACYGSIRLHTAMLLGGVTGQPVETYLEPLGVTDYSEVLGIDYLPVWSRAGVHPHAFNPLNERSYRVDDGLELDSSGSQCLVFRRRDSFWEISWHSSRTYLMKDTEGMRYLHLLLLQQGCEMRCDAMLGIYLPDSAFKREYVTDPKQFRKWIESAGEIRDQLQEIDSHLAEGSADIELREELQLHRRRLKKELLTLQLQIDQSSDHSGRLKREKAEAAEPTRRIRMAIQRALARIRLKCPLMAEHLDDCWRTGAHPYHFQYSPADFVNWNFGA